MRASVYVGIPAGLLLPPPTSYPLLELRSKATIITRASTAPQSYLQDDQVVPPVSKATVEALYVLAISPLLRVVTLTLTLSWADQLVPSQNITALSSQLACTLTLTCLTFLPPTCS